MCEYLLTLGCAAYVATHFPELGELAAAYPTARLWRMQARGARAVLKAVFCVSLRECRGVAWR